MRRIHPLEETPEPEPWGEAPRISGRAASFLCLAGLLVFQGFLLRSWIRREGRPPAWDQANHLEIALDYRRALAARDFDRILHLAPKPGMPPFPPLYHLSILYAQDSPDPARAALWINGLYLALLIASIWGLGRFFAGPWAGFAAALLFSCSPAVQELYFSQLVDLALTAWVACAYWALLESDGFSKGRYAALFGFLFAAAALTKWSAPSYFLPVLPLGWKACRTPGRRRGLLLAACLAAGLPAPWYLARLPVLLPRLVSASTDNAVSFWSGGALSYLWQMASGLDTPFWLLGLVSLAAAVHQRREEGWVLPAWFASSYLFWMVVPNHQLRYLLPGIVPLAILTAAAWPRWLLTVLCAYQAFAGANYSHGWISPKAANLGIPLSFFAQQIPARQDWKIEDILKAAQARQDKSAPFGNLTLVANHPYFNGPNFNWAAKRLGLENIRIRGVNRRICEFSEFLVVKTGSLGPEAVVNQLPEVQKLVLNKEEWFQRGYREIGRWPLPDQTQAVLFQRRFFGSPPVAETRVHFDYYEEADVHARDFSIDLGTWDSRRGVYPRVRLRAKLFDLKGLRIQGLDVVLEDVLLVPLKVQAFHVGASKRLSAKELLMDFRFLRLRRLALVSAKVEEEDLADFIKVRSRVREVECRLDKTVLVKMVFHGLSVEAEAAVASGPAGRSISARLVGLRLANVAIPVPLLGRYAVAVRSFEPDAELPFEIVAPNARAVGGRLVVGESNGR